MVAHKKVCLIAPSEDMELRSAMADTVPGERQPIEALKDCHLLEAALLTDRCIASLDDRARQHFVVAARTIGKLKSITWVNPATEEETPLQWLEDGAKVEKERLLGFEKRSG